MWKYWMGCEILYAALMPTVQHRYWAKSSGKKMKESWKSWKKTVHEKRFRVFKRFKNRKSLLTSKTQCQTQTGFRGLLSLANSPKNWKLNQEHPFRHMVCPFYRKDDLPLEHLPSSLTNVTSLDTKHSTGFFSKTYILFQPKLIWVKYKPVVFGGLDLLIMVCSWNLKTAILQICLLIRQTMQQQ